MFACQRDSYAKSLQSVVKSCEAVKFDGRDAFEVILEDTVLFPEGGGQVQSRRSLWEISFPPIEWVLFSSFFHDLFFLHDLKPDDRGAVSNFKDLKIQDSSLFSHTITQKLI